MKTIFIGSNNQGKLKEFSDRLKYLDIKLENPQSFDFNLDIAETGKSFKENALIKAKFWAEKTKLPTLVDDSGLCIDYLNGGPGILSNRFILGNDQDKYNKILDLLKDVSTEKRGAYFEADLIFIDPIRQIEKVFIGICPGKIANKASGNNGFGYDPIFIPDGFDLTFGQLPIEVKNRISHRAKALDKCILYLQQWANEI